MTSIPKLRVDQVAQGAGIHGREPRPIGISGALFSPSEGALMAFDPVSAGIGLGMAGVNMFMGSKPSTNVLPPNSI